MDSFDDYLAPASRAVHENIPLPNISKRWVPVRTLTSRHRDLIVKHLLALDEHDRYLRFGYVASDAQIARYVDQIDFDRDEIFGVFNRKLEVVAMAHLAYVEGTDGAQTRSAEFGVSVSVHLRGRRIGTRLFDHAMLHARNRGIDTLLIHALSENTPMIKIARHAGATVERNGGDSDAWLRLPPEDIASRLEALVEGGAAELDYSLKRRTRQIDGLLSTISEATSELVKPGRSSAQ